jgi:hypothetical protein
MCCLLTILVFMGPRAVLAVWWLVDQSWFNRLYENFIWPFLGFLFLPFTTLMYTLLALPGVGLQDWDWLWIGLSVVLDVASYAGGGYGNRGRIPGYSGSTSMP